MNNTILFDTFDTFMEVVDEGMPVTLEIDKAQLPVVFKNFNYPINSWPVVITNELSNELEQLSVQLPKLLQKIPSLYFGDDIKKIANYYFQGDEMLAQFSLLCANKLVPVSCRLDLVLTDDGYQVLEVNMGSSIGGMEFENFEPFIRSLHPPLDRSTNDGFWSRPTQSIYIKFVVDQVLENVSRDLKTLNVCLIGENEDERYKDEVTDFHNTILQKELEQRGMQGEVYFAHLRDLKFVNNQLYLNDTVIHSVLILNFALNGISPDVFRAFILDKVYFPDHLGTHFLRDKRNLALLRELAHQGKFSSLENQFILKSIPWTHTMAQKQVTYQGSSYDLVTLLKDRRSEFVIKVADGLQGMNVFVGKFLTAEEWEQAIVLALGDKPFIVQEFCNSKDLLAPDNSKSWTPHKLVWGSFGFGDHYGGCWVRMSRVGVDKGVINSATG
ncbi:MAG: hypothetical protein AAF466_12890, partial [Bacteroidota bacterium]